MMGNFLSYFQKKEKDNEKENDEDNEIEELKQIINAIANKELEKLKKVFSFLKRRAKNEPLEYIFNSAEFYGYDLYITKDVLIPRSETEQLVDLVSKSLVKEKNPDKILLWDICTGSGAIAIALKKMESKNKKFPKIEVIASDVSDAALLIAKKNANSLIHCQPANPSTPSYQ